MSLRDDMIRQLAKIEGELHGCDQAEDQLGDAADQLGAALDSELGTRRERLGAAGNDPADEDEYLALVRARYEAAQCGELAEREAGRRGSQATSNEVPDVSRDTD